MFAQSLLLSTLAVAASAASAQTSVSLFVGSAEQNAQYALSVVNVKDCTTTFGIVCTSGGFGTVSSSSLSCDPQETGLITVAPGTFAASTKTVIDGITAAVIAGCTFDGTTAATCSETISAAVSGTSTQTSATSTLSSSQISYTEVPVTAGASKLQSTCTASSASGNAAAPTGVLDVYKVLVVPAAALMAGAML